MTDKARPHDLWVFGYASLMWKPEFAHEEAAPARLFGYHRSLCVRSFSHRGTRARPGLVFGRDHGGSCVGRAFRVAAAKADEVRASLHAREMIYPVYRQVMRGLHLADGRRVRALCHVVERREGQYAGRLTPHERAAIVRASAGVMGRNRDYLASTIAHMDELGIADGPWHRLLALVDQE